MSLLAAIRAYWSRLTSPSIVDAPAQDRPLKASQAPRSESRSGPEPETQRPSLASSASASAARARNKADPRRDRIVAETRERARKMRENFEAGRPLLTGVRSEENASTAPRARVAMPAQSQSSSDTKSAPVAGGKETEQAEFRRNARKLLSDQSASAERQSLGHATDSDPARQAMIAENRARAEVLRRNMANPAEAARYYASQPKHIPPAPREVHRPTVDAEYVLRVLKEHGERSVEIAAEAVATPPWKPEYPVLYDLTPEEREIERELWGWGPSQPAERTSAPANRDLTPPGAERRLPAERKKQATSRRKVKPKGPQIPLGEVLERCVIYDLETTGLRAESEYIIQIGAAKVRGGRIVDRLSMLVKPPVRIPPFIAEYTGITNDAVRRAPRAIQAIRAFSDWVGDDLLVAHNGLRFDRGFLKAELQRGQHPLRETQGLDTLSIAKLVHPVGTSKGLDALSEFYEIESDGRRHEAAADVELLFAVLEALVEHAGSSGHELAPLHTVWLAGEV